MFANRILILIPHPDDEVVGAFAAVERARTRGCQVLGAYLTSGVPSGEELWPWNRGRRDARTAERWSEAARAAALLGIETVLQQDLPSRRLKEHFEPTRDQLLAILGGRGADVLWTPAYEGGHQDHDAANFLAATLRDQIEVWEFSEYNYAGRRVRSQEFPSTAGGEEEIVLDGPQRGQKRAALALYRSERGNLRHIRAEREVFRPLPAHDYSRPPHPGKLFYQRFQWVPLHPRVDHTRPEEVRRSLLAHRIKPAEGAPRRPPRSV